MLPPEQHRPRNATRVLALQEKGLGFAVLEAKDFAVAADVELTLDRTHKSANFSLMVCYDKVCRCEVPLLLLGGCGGSGALGEAEEVEWTEAYLAGVDLLAAEGVVVGTHDGGR